MTSRKLVLVRHGESMGNYWKPAYKNDATNFLSNLGVRQAEILGIYLKRSGFNFKYIVSSNLTRARQTTAMALISMDDWQRHYEIDPNLNECHDYSSEGYTEDGNRVRQGVDNLLNNWTDGDALCVSHYFTMQYIFDYLPPKRENIESHHGKTIPNAVPFVFDLSDQSKIIKLDPSLHGPQY